MPNELRLIDRSPHNWDELRAATDKLMTLMHAISDVGSISDKKLMARMALNWVRENPKVTQASGRQERILSLVINHLAYDTDLELEAQTLYFELIFRSTDVAYNPGGNDLKDNPILRKLQSAADEMARLYRKAGQLDKYVALRAVAGKLGSPSDSDIQEAIQYIKQNILPPHPTIPAS
jgi:hypothetical protein